MIDIMNGGGKYGSHDFQFSKNTLQWGRKKERERKRVDGSSFPLFFSYIECWGIEQNMHWLTNISSMSFIMVGNLLVMIFKGEQVGDQRSRLDRVGSE